MNFTVKPLSSYGKTRKARQGTQTTSLFETKTGQDTKMGARGASIFFKVSMVVLTDIILQTSPYDLLQTSVQLFGMTLGPTLASHPP